ncbi:MAG TPA: iron-sulfur cluster assembly protein [Anaerolineaceae bacterium]
MNEHSHSNAPTWDIEQTHPEVVDPLKNALREVTDPEINLNVIQLGLIRNVTIQEQRAIIKMTLTTPFCPYGPAMLETTRQKAEHVLQMETQMEYSMEPWDFSMMEDGLAADWGLF